MPLTCPSPSLSGKRYLFEGDARQGPHLPSVPETVAHCMLKGGAGEAHNPDPTQL